MQSTLTTHPVAASKRDIDPKLGDLFQQLCLQERDDAPDNPHIPDRNSYMDPDTDGWIQAEYKWALDEAADSAVSLPYLDDEGPDACGPHIYDPTLFSPPQSKPSSPSRRSIKLHDHNDDKPLPEVPQSPRFHAHRPPPIPPPSPRSPRVFASSPLSPPLSPRLAEFPSPPVSPQSRAFPRSRPPSTSNASMASVRNTPPKAVPTKRHATYPSISSTLDLLGDRETELEKRAGVYVDPAEPSVVEKIAATPRSRSGSVMTSSGSIGRGSVGRGSVGRSSIDTPRASMGTPRSSMVVPGPSFPPPVRKQRPALPTLLTSTSSPQLRTLAQLAATTPSASTATLIPARPSFSSLSGASASSAPQHATASAPVTSAHTPQIPPLGIEEEEQQLPSRWSLDSIASRPAPSAYTPPPGAAPASPQSAKARKRDRLISFISRGRSGSLGKVPAASGSPSARPSLDVARRSTSKEPLFEMVAPPSISASSSLSSSVSSLLATPLDSAAPSPRPQYSDPFSPTSDSFFPDSGAKGRFAESADEFPAPPPSPPPEPTLPLPSPGTPTASFFFPPRPPSLFAALRLSKRRKRKLVISGAPFSEGTETHAFARAALGAEDLALRRGEQRRRYENVVRWCEGFGALRKIERKDDGSLHVYWKDWEVADRVCRIQAQVYIKDVGRVSLAWHYIN
ncbi:hypothetical protein OBBRIDRAFT_415717 [Obba rivulosa]|uniref:Uncharacterized protein n=1 Tax=Obba rivulosa TaxID=1052685 RepID=A0A8E2AH12_9APHY|nr:hypothetical protein OBBRIDRAFT_415717 [Obba rivulosa]